jgi:hypothetical protein
MSQPETESVESSQATTEHSCVDCDDKTRWDYMFRCSICKENVCQSCSTECDGVECHNFVCRECVYTCSCCPNNSCRDCSITCDNCEYEACDSCVEECCKCLKRLCDGSDEKCKTFRSCHGNVICAACFKGGHCRNCEAPLCGGEWCNQEFQCCGEGLLCVERCAAKCAQCETWGCKEVCIIACDHCRAGVCKACLVTCAACGGARCKRCTTVCECCDDRVCKDKCVYTVTFCAPCLSLAGRKRVRSGS